MPCQTIPSITEESVSGLRGGGNWEPNRPCPFAVASIQLLGIRVAAQSTEPIHRDGTASWHHLPASHGTRRGTRGTRGHALWPAFFDTFAVRAGSYFLLRSYAVKTTGASRAAAPRARAGRAVPPATYMGPWPASNL